MALTYEQIQKKVSKSMAPGRKAALDAVNKKYKTQANQLTENYTSQINETTQSYDDLYQQNAVQKEINKRQIAENMANLGLTDSGLNRTQLTAVELSHANNRGKLDRQKQQAVDKLALSLRNGLAELQGNKQAEIGSVNSTYDKAIADEATKMYNQQLKTDAENKKNYYSYLSKVNNNNTRSGGGTKSGSNGKVWNLINADGSTLSREYIGTLGDNGVNVVYDYDDVTGNINGYTYIDTITGKKTTFKAGVNPYTGKKNGNVAYGTYDNGYQPDNIGKDANGKVMKLTTAKGKDGNVATAKVSYAYNQDGQPEYIEQKIFQYGSSYYIWNPVKNKIGGYEKLSKDDLKKQGIYVN